MNGEFSAMGWPPLWVVSWAIALAPWMVPIDSVDPNPDQPRQAMGDLSELISSVAEKGIIEPLVVRQKGSRYQIVAGERRYHAAVQSGLTEVPVVIRDVDDTEMLELALVENIQRKDLTAFEESEALQSLGVPPSHPAVRAAVSFLEERQEPDGTWYGRWGVNYIYGTWLALRGLAHAGEDLSQPCYQRAGAWLRAHQNADGGWGELPRSYDDPSTKGRGPSTAAQTAWALMALFALGEARSEAVERGVAYLLREQEYDGSWRDTHWTGTGFPKVFYLRYHLYATYFPLWALALYEGESRQGQRTGRLVRVRRAPVDAAE